MFANKKVVVTGGTGMIGRKVVDLLLKEGAIITVLADKGEKIREGVEYTFGDLASDFEFCQTWTENADYVFHIAGLKGSPVVTSKKPASYFVPLLQMNTNILEACRINGVRGVVYTSSVGVYEQAERLKESNPQGKPMDTFPGYAKWMGELQIQAYKMEYGINYSVVRPSNVYGEGDNFDPEIAMVIPSLVGKILRGDDPVIVWGDGSEIRDFVYSGDVAKGIIQTMEKGTKGEFINLGGANEYSIKDVVDALRIITGAHFRYDFSKKAGFPKRVMDISLARKLIGYDPETTLEEGLEKVWKSVRPH